MHNMVLICILLHPYSDHKVCHLLYTYDMVYRHISGSDLHSRTHNTHYSQVYTVHKEENMNDIRILYRYVQPVKNKDKKFNFSFFPRYFYLASIYIAIMFPLVITS